MVSFCLQIFTLYIWALNCLRCNEEIIYGAEGGAAAANMNKKHSKQSQQKERRWKCEKNFKPVKIIV